MVCTSQPLAALGEHPQTRLGGKRLRCAHHVVGQDRLAGPGVREVPSERLVHLRERNAGVTLAKVNQPFGWDFPYA
ncbi:hypothetical protein JHV675_52380 [Mycobacterium avium subsp. hominissuis]